MRNEQNSFLDVQIGHPDWKLTMDPTQTLEIFYLNKVGIQRDVYRNILREMLKTSNENGRLLSIGNTSECRERQNVYKDLMSTIASENKRHKVDNRY